MAGRSRRYSFHLGMLVAGFLLGGFLSALLKRFLPDSAARTFFTYSVTPTIGPVSADLLVVSFTLGPVGVNVSIMSVIGVVIAYYAAKSLF